MGIRRCGNPLRPLFGSFSFITHYLLGSGGKYIELHQKVRLLHLRTQTRMDQSHAVPFMPATPLVLQIQHVIGALFFFFFN